MTQLKRIDEMARDLILNLLGPSKTFEVQDTGIMAVCFRTPADATGEQLFGCLCAMVTAPGLNVAKLQQVALLENMILQRAPFKSPNDSRPIAPGGEGLSKAEIRKRQAIETDKIWTALEWLLQEPESTRMSCMAERAPAIFLQFEQNPKLGALAPRIEDESKLTPLVQSVWRALSNNSSWSNFFSWRRKAGLPRRRMR